MVITYFGGGSYRLQNGDISLLLDPENNRLKADVVLRTLSPSEVKPPTAQDEIEVAFPGEYEIKGIEISGIGLPTESNEKFLKTAYLIAWDDLKIVFLGHLSEMPSADIIEAIEEPDVLVVPVGGGHFLDSEVAVKLVKQLEPSIVLPAFAKNPGEFPKLMGQKAESEEKFVFKKKDLVNEKNKVVILEPKI